MTHLLADDYEFRIAAMDCYPGTRQLASPEGKGWFLFQVVPDIRGGGSFLGGYSGTELRNAAVETRVLCVWARKKEK